MDERCTRRRNSSPISFFPVARFIIPICGLENPGDLARGCDEPQYQKNNRENRVRVELAVQEPPNKETDERRYGQQGGDRREKTRLADRFVAVVSVPMSQGFRPKDPKENRSLGVGHPGRCGRGGPNKRSNFSADLT
jgi:hypothetical protein